MRAADALGRHDGGGTPTRLRDDAGGEVFEVRSGGVDGLGSAGLGDVGGVPGGKGEVGGVEEVFVGDLVAGVLMRGGEAGGVGGVGGGEGGSGFEAAVVAGFVFVVGFGAGPEVSAAAEEGADALVAAVFVVALFGVGDEEVADGFAFLHFGVVVDEGEVGGSGRR